MYNTGETMAQKYVHIIGAGLTGLTCAFTLQKAGIPYTILESTERVGGRVSTDNVDGFLLDRGFQVLLDSYPNAMKFFEGVSLNRFDSGALIWSGHNAIPFYNPLKSPSKIINTLQAPFLSFKDIVALATLILRTWNKSVYHLPEVSMETESYLRDQGFSADFLESFLLPFFRGIFLEQKLVTDKSFFEFLFSMFQKGTATLPENGMQELPGHLSSTLPKDAVQYKHRILDISDSLIICEEREPLAYDKVVVTERALAEMLLKKKKCVTKSTWCLYFAIDGAPPYSEKLLFLNGSRDGVINNLCFPSSISNKYAPIGKSLCSVTVLSDVYTGDEDELQKKVITELKSIFGQSVQQWRHLKTYFIEHALPEIATSSTPFLHSEDIYYAGDYTRHPSIEGAMIAGEKVAAAITKS